VEIAALTAFLAPFLPTLVKAGEQVVRRAADAVADEAFTYARALWERLKPKVEEKPAAQEAAEEVAARPAPPTPRRGWWSPRIRRRAGRWRRGRSSR
jgi:hypothetical protein